MADQQFDFQPDNTPAQGDTSKSPESFGFVPDQPTWKSQPVDVSKLDTSGFDFQPDQEERHYMVANGQLHFDIGKQATGLRQAVADGVADKDWAAQVMPDFQRAQVKYQDFEEAAGGAQTAKALLNGAGRGAAFLAAAGPGGEAGAAIGTAAAGGPEDPLALITAPVGAAIGSLTAGTIASAGYSKAVDKMADYNEFVKSLSASAELHPVANAAGELAAFASSAPNSISKLYRLSQMGEAGTAWAQVAKGAAAGAAFEGVIRPGFDIARHLVADQLGIPHDQTQAPTLSSMAQNVALGILTAGHSIEFKDIPGGTVANITMRAKAREAAGIGLRDDDPAAVIDGFNKLGAPDTADLQKNGLLAPLSPDEIEVYDAIRNKMAELKQSGDLTDQQIKDLGVTLAKVGRTTISQAKVTLKPKEGGETPPPQPPERKALNAPTPVVEQTSVSQQHQGTDEIGETQNQPSGGNSVPSPTGQPAPAQPAQAPAQPATPAPAQRAPVADPKWQVTVGADGTVNIGSIKNGSKEWSKSPEDLTGEGYAIPDFSKLPKGNYTFDEAVDRLSRPQATAPTPTPQTPKKVTVTDVMNMTPEQFNIWKKGALWSPQVSKEIAKTIKPEQINDIIKQRDQLYTRARVLKGEMEEAFGRRDEKTANEKMAEAGPIDLKAQSLNELLQDHRTLHPEAWPQVGGKGWYYDSPTGFSNDPVEILEELPKDKVGRRRFKIKSGSQEWVAHEEQFTKTVPRGAKPSSKAAPVAEEQAMFGDKPLGVSKAQWDEMAKFNDYDQVDKWGYSRAMLIEKATTGNMPAPPKRPTPQAPKGSKGPSIRERKKQNKPEAKDVDVSNAKNPYQFASGDRIVDLYTRTEYEVVKSDVKGMAELKNVETGEIEDWNAYNNPRFEIAKPSETPTVPTEPEPKPVTDVDQPTESQSGGVGHGGEPAPAAGAPGAEQPTGGNFGQPDQGIQSGVREENAGSGPAGGGGDSRIADADANGVPAQPAAEAPLIPSADTGVETSPGVRGQPTTDDPAPAPEVSGDPVPENIRLSENPAPTTPTARVKANIEALALVKRLQAESRFPTDEERKTLAQWSGWGSFKEMFNDARAEKRTWDVNWMKKYGTSYDKLKRMMTDAEWVAAIESTVNAHYTSEEVVKAMWNLVRRLGFRGGKALEPATGSGVFVGFIPDDLANKTRWAGCEMEPITGQIFKYLYPQVSMNIEPYENAKLPNGYFDLVITNVPFHETGPGKEYPTLNLHNYFLARSLDKVRPGGLVVAITTNATMDNDGNGRKEQRGIIVDKSQLVGAIRLPNDAFKGSAGTEVVTDILILRKPDAKPYEEAQEWKHTSEVQTEEGPARINQYFVDHPEMVLGKNSLTGTMYRKDSYTVESTPGKLEDKLAEAIKLLPEDIMQPKPETIEPVQTKLEEGSLSLDEKGRVLEARNFLLQTPMSWDSASHSLVKRAKLYIGLRDLLKRQYDMEDDPEVKDSELEANRANLRRAYQAMVKELGGAINQSERKTGYLSTDPDYYTVMGVEVVRERPDPKKPEDTITVAEPADVLTKRVKTPDRPPTTAADAADAVGISMSYQNRFDMDYVMQLTGMTQEAVENELIAKDMGYKDPESGGFVTKNDYLSGDVRQKLARAIFAAKESPQFDRNVEALKKVIPETTPFGRIRLTFGARWAPPQVFNAFAKEVIGTAGTEIIFIPGTEEFAVKPSNAKLSQKAVTEWQTNDMTTYDLMRNALSSRRAKVMRTVMEPNDSGKMVEKQREDTEASALCNQIIDRMHSEFQSWVRSTQTRVPLRYFDVDRGEYMNDNLPVWDVLEREFNRTKNSVVDPPNDGSMLKLPGLSNQVRRPQHLVNGVMRSVNMGSSVFGHGVGSGKTFLLTVINHELKRIGLMRKGVMAVKKPTVDQFRASIERAYPGSRVLIPSEKDFKPANRKKLAARIASSNWDFIVLTHEQLKAIRPSEKAVQEFYDDQIQQLRDILRDMGAEKHENAQSTRGLDPEVKNIVKKMKSLKKRLDKHITAIKKHQDTGMEWEKLGIDGLLIDESHNFKKMPLATQLGDEIKGIPSDFSQRAVDLLIKTRDVQKRTKGRNIFFASGTPVSNTLAELWVMFNATNPQLLKQFGITTFDSFATAYADVVTNFEIGWDGFGHDVTRMSRFKNPASLTLLTRLGMDVKIGNKELGLDVPDLEGGKPIIRVIKPTPAFEQWISFLRNIVDSWNALDKRGRFENSYIPILTMRTGVAAALDPRCAFAGAQDHPDSKVNTAVKDIFAEWEKGKERRTTMMVFADLYRTMKTDKLANFAGGVPKRPDVEEEVELPEVGEGSDDSGDTSSKDESDYAKNCIGNFNVYQDMKAKLMRLGIPENEIAVITDHDTDAKRAVLFNKVRAGAVRILFGSTEKIGEGVDVATRMSAAFNLDPPMQMTPAKQEQRNGRLIRQGNLHSPKNWNIPVRLYHYVQEKSMDAAINQMLATKAVMVLQALKGQFLGDEFEDPAGELISTMAELMAAATGDNRVLELAKLQKEVRDLSLEEGAFQRRISELRRNVDTQQSVANSNQQDAQNMAVLSKAIDVEIADPTKIVLSHKDKRYVGTDAIDAFLERVSSAMDAEISKDIGQRKKMHFKIGTGVNVELEGVATVNQHDMSGPLNKRYYATFFVGPELTYSVPQWQSNMNSPEGLINALTNVPRFAMKRAQDSTVRAAEASKLVDAYAEQFKNTKFEKGPILAEKLSKKNALESELRAEGKASAEKAEEAQRIKRQAIVQATPSGPAQVMSMPADDEVPLEDRLRAQIEATKPPAQNLKLEMIRAAARANLLPAGHPERMESLHEYHDLQEELYELEAHRADLGRQLAEVLKKNNPTKPVELPKDPKKPALSIQPTPNSVGEERIVRGLQELTDLLASSRSGLSEEARRVGLDLLNTPVMQNLDWSNLTVALKNRIGAGYSGAADVVRNLIEIARSASPTAIPHEVFHLLYHMLPTAEKRNVEMARREALNNDVKEISGGEIANLPQEIQDLVKLLWSGEMASDAFVQQLNRLQAEGETMFADWWARQYHLINPSEFLAGMAGNKFSRDSFDSQRFTWWDAFIAKLKAWVRAIMDSLKRVLGIRPDIEQIYREILAGRLSTTPESGQEWELGRQGSFEGEPAESSGLDPADLEIEGAPTETAGTGGNWINTEVLGRKDKVRGRETLTDAERAAGADYAKQVFDRAGLQVTQQDNGLWQLTDPSFDAEVEGRKLLDLLQKEIAVQNQPGSVSGYLGNLLNSVVVNMTQDSTTAFSPELRRELYSLAQGERSQRGLLLGALAGFGKTVDYIARNVDVVLSKVYSDRYGGDEIRKILGTVLTNFRGFFTDEEIKRSLDGDPAFTTTINRVIDLARRDEGGRVYRRAQSLLKPKARKTLGRLEADARVTEAVNEILAQLKKQGIEPKESPNKPLPPLQKLLMLVHPETAKKIDAAIAQAVQDAERNAGIKATIKAAQTPEEQEDLLQRFAAGEEPDEDAVEDGLALPEFAHWKALRDNLLGYSPTTMKVVQQLIQSDFKGVNYRAKSAQKPVDTKIDLNVLAKQPDDEVRRVLNAYAQNIDANMVNEEATEETRLRIVDMIHQTVTAQIERIRAQMRDRALNPSPSGRKPTDAADALQALINAKVFSDPRINSQDIVNRLANGPALQKLAPKVSALIKTVIGTPFYRQDELAQRFADEMASRFQIPPEQAETARKAFLEAFNVKMNKARSSAFDATVQRLTPQQRAFMRQSKPTWQKIKEAVNAGVFDTGIVLQTIAAAQGWHVPTAQEIGRIKALAIEIDRLNTLSPIETARIKADNPSNPEPKLAEYLRDKQAATLDQRIALKKKIETAWARMTQPMTLGTKQGRTNIAQAINEFTSANLLFKIGFPSRLGIDILTQGALHTPTRAVVAAITRYQNDQSAGRAASLWSEINSALRDAYRVRLASTKANLVSAAQAMRGKGDTRNVDRLVSRIAVFERMELKAEELTAKGDNFKAGALRLLHLISFSYRVAQTLDNFQGLPAEVQEMRQQVETTLRENGMSRAEAVAHADSVMGDMRAEWQLAIARVGEIMDANGIQGTPNDIRSAVGHVIKSRQYARMKALGLAADDFQEINRILRSTIAWAEREDAGIGGYIGTTMRKSTDILARAGLPMPLARFSNAIATGINRSLMFTPLGFFPQAFEGSPWMRTPEDRLQRKIEAGLGSSFGLLFAALVMAGIVKVWLKPPQDPTERALWEKEGHRANTMELTLPDGSFIPISLLIGPGRYVAPYVAAAGAIRNRMDKNAAEQAKLNAEAAKNGLPAGKVPALGPQDYLAAAGSAAYQTLLGGRTASGLVSSFTDENQINVSKAVSAAVSPVVPGLPAVQEMSRMAGVSLDPKMAGVFDFMVPLPTSAAARSNLLGDGVGTESGVQRVTQILTGGSYPFPVQPSDAHNLLGYQALFESGYRPPSINENKAYALDGMLRPMDKAELTKYTTLRAQFLKQALSEVADPTDKKQVKAAYEQANAQALQAVGVQSEAPQSSGGSQTSRATPGAVGSAPSHGTVRHARGSRIGRGRRVGHGRLGHGPAIRGARPLSARRSVGRGRHRRLA